MSASSGLCATSRLCRRASAANSGECTSGTQIWIGRIPWARRRWRCSRTLRRLAARRAAWGSPPGAASASTMASAGVTCHASSGASLAGLSIRPFDYRIDEALDFGLLWALRHQQRLPPWLGGACTSGTQIWLGRIPWARRRWRCARTLRLLAARWAAL